MFSKKLTWIILKPVAVNTQGLPHTLKLTTADVTDLAVAVEMFKLHSGSLTAVVIVLADGNYTGRPFVAAVDEVQGTTVEIVKRSELSHLCGDSETLGGRMFICLAVEMSTTFSRIVNGTSTLIFRWSSGHFDLSSSKDFEQIIRTTSSRTIASVNRIFSRSEEPLMAYTVLLKQSA